jgi:CDP-paratose 2-epimerase
MHVLITGGAGFIGCSAAVALLRQGEEVMIFDNLSRVGTEQNLQWLKGQGAVRFIQGDVREADLVKQVLREHAPDAVIHLAGQVAVTSSIVDPQHDFSVNANGTLNLLEAVRALERRPILLFSSTNKVYGALEDLPCVRSGSRYEWSGRPAGIDEQQPLDFHSPYGCSKGAADQYVRDYARIYGLRTVVLRQSCIYGPRQFGVEDQGWLAWFAICALMGRAVTIFGDGGQVRDLLYIEDLIRLYQLCLQRPEQAAGRIFNIGGGPNNAWSVLEVLELLEAETGRPLERHFCPWRPGDQKIFIASISEAERCLGWRPQVTIREGLPRLLAWIRSNLESIQTLME